MRSSFSRFRCVQHDEPLRSGGYRCMPVAPIIVARHAMDPISGLGSAVYAPSWMSSAPAIPSSSPTGQVPASTPMDSVDLSSTVDASSPSITYDANLAGLFQSDPSLAQDLADGTAAAQFGFDNQVLSNDDTLTSSPPASATTSTAAGGSSATNDGAISFSPDQRAELASLGSESQFSSSMLTGSTAALGATSAFFVGSSMSQLLMAQGAAALAYLTPQAAATAGVVVDAAA
jgi:hypothetical protein